MAPRDRRRDQARVSLSLSAAQLARAEAGAAANDLRVQDWLRDLIDGLPVCPPPPTAFVAADLRSVRATLLGLRTELLEMHRRAVQAYEDQADEATLLQAWDRTEALLTALLATVRPPRSARQRRPPREAPPPTGRTPP